MFHPCCQSFCVVDEKSPGSGLSQGVTTALQLLKLLALGAFRQTWQVSSSSVGTHHPLPSNTLSLSSNLS